MEEFGPFAIIVPIFAIFSIFIALPWIILQFFRSSRAATRPVDPAMNASLLAIAEKLDRRLDAIETILDHEVPGWRRSSERASDRRMA